MMLFVFKLNKPKMSLYNNVNVNDENCILFITNICIVMYDLLVDHRNPNTFEIVNQNNFSG